ncbi:MAG: PhzF family phenazine biosynthesis protein [Dermatophilaceae bacterium]
MHRFSQVNVFSTEPLRGNPLAVVHAADDVDEATMRAFANWTNLSETTFLLAPTDPAADYRVRIFTTRGELPFAGHPTLGSAHAWLEAGGQPRKPGVVVQECGAGLVPVRTEGRLAFAAPALNRSGPVEADLVRRVVAAVRLDPADVLDAAWCDNGPGWIGIRLTSAAAVLAADPDPIAMTDLKVGLIGPYADPTTAGAAYEVRAFYGDGQDYGEDPVTGSLNAALAQWLIPIGAAPASYVASQGTVLGRRGRIHVDAVGAEIRVGGDVVTVVSGEVALPEG